MSVTEVQPSLFRKLLTTTLVVAPVAAFIALLSLGVMMALVTESGRNEFVGAVLGFLQPWVFLVRSNGGVLWAIVWMGLPFLIYAWLWTAGRFYKMRALHIGIAIACIHVAAWALNYLM